MGIYSDYNGSLRNLSGQSDEYITPYAATYEQIFLDLQEPVKIEKDTAYWLAFHANGNINVEHLKGNSICGKYQTTPYYGILPDEFTVKSTTNEMSISAW